jgi:hypothetical protein
MSIETPAAHLAPLKVTHVGWRIERSATAPATPRTTVTSVPRRT